jgi:hypothetical protein
MSQNICSIICECISPLHGASSGCGWKNGLCYGRKLRIYSKNSIGQSKGGGPPALGSGEVLTTSRRKTVSYYESFTQNLRTG